MAEQIRALEETRARMTADLGAREAALTQREDAALAAARKREDELRRRSAQDEQVRPRLAFKYNLGPCRRRVVSLKARSRSSCCKSAVDDDWLSTKQANLACHYGHFLYFVADVYCVRCD